MDQRSSGSSLDPERPDRGAREILVLGADSILTPASLVFPNPQRELTQYFADVASSAYAGRRRVAGTRCRDTLDRRGHRSMRTSNLGHPLV